MVVLGILADLISTNRKLIQEAIFIQRKRLYDENKNRNQKKQRPKEWIIGGVEQELHNLR